MYHALICIYSLNRTTTPTSFEKVDSGALACRRHSVIKANRALLAKLTSARRALTNDQPALSCRSPDGRFSDSLSQAPASRRNNSQSTIVNCRALKMDLQRRARAADCASLAIVTSPSRGDKSIVTGDVTSGYCFYRFLSVSAGQSR